MRGTISPNPFLPDGGQARFASGIGVEDFIREMTVVEYGPDRLLRTGRHHAVLAEEENLAARAEAVRERLELLKLTVEERKEAGRRKFIYTEG